MQRLALALLLVLPMCACATGVDRVKLLDPMAPTPADWESELVEAAYAFEPPPASAEAPRFQLVSLEDDRADVTALGAQRNTFGKVMGTVELDERVRFEDVFAAHLVSCFRDAGLELVLDEGGAERARAGLVEVEIDVFWTDFVPGVFTVDARSEVRFDVAIRTGAGSPLLVGTYHGEGELSSALGVTRAMFEESLNLAHAQAMRELRDALVREIGPRIGADARP